MITADTNSEDNGMRVRSYLESWDRKDLTGIGKYLQPQVHFKSPTSETTGKEVFLEAAKRIFPLLHGVTVRFVFVCGEQAAAIYDFNCLEPVGVSRTAELITFQDGLIARVELFFDASPFARLAKQ
jgi:ketosteroid isomerase-like protein